MRITIEARKKKIKKIVSTEYQSRSDLAADFLSVVEGADLEEQRELFALFLKTHNVHRKTEVCGLNKSSMSTKEWENICIKLADEMRALINSVFRNNASLEETASRLWDRVTLCEGKDRIVAIAILLSGHLTPYIQMPSDLTETRPSDVYDEARDQIVDELALLNRLLETKDISKLEITVGLVKILDRIQKPEEKTAFLLEFVMKSYWYDLDSSFIEKIIGKIISPDL